MRLGFILSLLLLLSTPALAAVDLEIPINAAIKGTIPRADVDQTFRFEATKGTLLKFAAAGKGLDLAVTLEDPEGRPVTITTAPGFRDTGSKVSLSKFPLAMTGLWKLTVTSRVTGPYSMKMKGVPAKKAGGTVNVPAGGSTPVLFSAPAGSLVTLKAKIVKGSTAEPRFGMFEGEDLTDLGKSSTKSHAVKVGDISGGDIFVEVQNLAASSGDVKVTVKVKAPKVAKAKLDITAENLGAPADGGTALGRTVEADAGGVVAVNDATSSIDGAGVEVDAGALPETTTITVASAPAITPPDNRQVAGPAVAFGPEGLTFTKPVEVRLPYSPGAIPAGATAADLRVLHVMGNGSEETLTPTTVDETNHELTVETTSFSEFMPIAPKGPPNLDGRKYWVVLLDLWFETEPMTNDSRFRSYNATTGVVTFGAAGEAGTSVSLIDNETDWGHDFDDNGQVDTETNSETVALTWSYAAGNKAITISDGSDDDSEWALGADGSVLVGGTNAGPDEPYNQLHLAIEKPATPHTRASLAGDFWVYQFGTEIEDNGGPLAFWTNRAFGSVTFKKDGKLSDASTERYCEFNGSSPVVSCAKDSWNDTNDWVVAGAERGIFEGAVIVDWTDDDGMLQEVVLMPSADGNILVAATESAVVIAVRKSSGMSLAKVAGDYELRGLDLELVTYPGTNGTLGDLDVSSFGGATTIATKGTIEFDISNRVITRDPNVAGGVSIEFDGDSGTTKIKVGKGGDLTIDSDGDDTVGAFTPDGGFGFAYDSPNNNHGLYGIFFLLKTP